MTKYFVGQSVRKFLRLFKATVVLLNDYETEIWRVEVCDRVGRDLREFGIRSGLPQKKGQ